ncbi:MAG TPA: diacylglycerol kinase family protein, partial [Dehalococcoidia bacterium]|nr:diacylglycerol kinase family protein [Dehalococcoidia bacterium]
MTQGVRTARVIVNPAAGSGRTRTEWPKTIVALREAGLEPDYVLTQRPGEATDLAMQAAQGGYDLVVAVGGDGTAHEVANGLLQAHAPPPLGLIQTGTGRDLSRLLRLPKDYDGQAKIVATATPLRMDVGRCRYVGASGETEERAFLLLAGAGYSARVVERSLRLKRWFRGLAYLVAAVQ